MVHGSQKMELWSIRLYSKEKRKNFLRFDLTMSRCFLESPDVSDNPNAASLSVPTAID